MPRYYREKIFNKYEREEQSVKSQALQDKKDIEKYNSWIESGTDIGLANFEEKRQYIENIKKRLTKSKSKL